MSTEEKFNAAVNVIRSLPKNGSYQPSNDLMLRFYAYFKQATIGPCTGNRPPFYDLVNRAKFDAWKGLGDMPKTMAMKKYVDELHTIVETMSYSDKVANFLEASTNELDAINMNDLELVVGDVIERVKSQPNSPLTSREASPVRLSLKHEPSTISNNDDSDDEYIDTIEFPDTKKFESAINGMERISRTRLRCPSNIDITQDITKTVQNLKNDIENLVYKMNNIEKLLNRNSEPARRKVGLFNGMSFDLCAFILLWPFLATFIINRYLLIKK